MANEATPGPSGSGGPARGVLIVVFIAAFAAAFLLAWLLFRQPVTQTPPPAEPAKEVTRVLVESDLDPFFAAVEKSDYSEMTRLGDELFEEGATVKDADRVFAGFEVNSYSPYRIFAFFTNRTDERLYRVLLTLDENDKVESFLAEDMRIIQHTDEPVETSDGVTEIEG